LFCEVSEVDGITILNGKPIGCEPLRNFDNPGKTMSTKDITNYRCVNDQISTSGQPTEEQLRAAAAKGFKTVINLATIDPRYSLEDEAGLVQSLGMAYHHIPVEWEQPQASDFAAFEAVMLQLPPSKTLIHCAANFRVTAFYSLYAIKQLGWTETQAAEFRASIWADSDYPVWEKFIGEMQTNIKQEGQTR
jgi:protein tyrosine phosphatase (PTP) superfamily phosphohydrolase (DUF442 family)